MKDNRAVAEYLAVNLVYQMIHHGVGCDDFVHEHDEHEQQFELHALDSILVGAWVFQGRLVLIDN